MCGRYASTADPTELVDLFDIDEVADDLPPASYNVAPTDRVPAVLERVVSDTAAQDAPNGTTTRAGTGADNPGRQPAAARRVVRRLRPLRWGLVPSWAKDLSIGSRMINARLETIAEKPAFRRAFAARRCLLPADGYYEWYGLSEQTNAAGKPAKQPFFLHRADGGPLVMAGIYEYWKNPAAEPGTDPWVLSCSVVTTTATDAAGHIHDRMPMVIGEDAWASWLNPSLTDPDAALELLQVTQADQLEAYAVSTLVNSVRNNAPELVAPLAASG